MAAAFPQHEDLDSDQEMHNKQELCDLAARMRADQGNHECEVISLEEGEEEEARLRKQRAKNPGHKDFIPVKEFARQHLPTGLQTDDDVEFIKAMADLTVRLRVGRVSASRPDGYAFAEFRGCKIPHYGTGWVYKVRRDLDGHSPHCWVIEVRTACHVVYDDEEARITQVDLFCDDENSQVTTLQGHRVLRRDEENDVCFFECYTTDTDLAQKLEALIDQSKTLRRRINDKPYATTFRHVVSPPHGETKKVTIGGLSLSDFMAKSLNCEYTTATRNGSSGAPAMEFRRYYGRDDMPSCAGPHCKGHVDERKTLNHSLCRLFSFTYIN